MGNSTHTVKVVSAVSHLHSLGIVHGDIKDENIMVDTADLRVNIIDLGSAAREDGGRTRSVCGVDRDVRG